MEFLVEPLLKGGFIYADDFPDEIDVIAFNYDKGKYAGEYINLTIAPTMDCNFNCYYCYEPWKVINPVRIGKKTLKIC